MSTQQVEILFISGSPRAHSSEALLALLEQGVREVGARSRKFLLSKKFLTPCKGCGSCEKTGICIMADEGSPRDASSPQKADDDYLELLDALSHADALAIVAPLYFSGPSAQLKALFDRMQPFWSRQYSLGLPPLDKRPAQIFILGGGGDNHGYDPLVTISRSALAVAGFTVEKVQNFIGFKYPKSVAPLPSEEQAAELPYSELARLRKEAALQQEFEQRAIAAGRAFARQVTRQLIGSAQPAEEAEASGTAKTTEAAEAAEAEKDAPASTALSETSEDNSSAQKSDSQTDDKSSEKPAESPDDTSKDILFEVEHETPIKIIDRVDSDFEALKVAARASKSSKTKHPELDAAMEEAVALLSEQHSVKSATSGETGDEPSVNQDE